MGLKMQLTATRALYSQTLAYLEELGEHVPSHILTWEDVWMEMPIDDLNAELRKRLMQLRDEKEQEFTSVAWSQEEWKSKQAVLARIKMVLEA